MASQAAVREAVLELGGMATGAAEREREEVPAVPARAVLETNESGESPKDPAVMRNQGLRADGPMRQPAFAAAVQRAREPGRARWP